MGFEADEFIGRILTSIPTREPLLPALGGLPFGLDGHIEERLTALSEFDIKPVFVFNGLNPYGQERKLDAQLRAISSIKTAWDYYSASHPDLAVAEFGNNCTFGSFVLYGLTCCLRQFYFRLFRHRANLSLRSAFPPKKANRFHDRAVQRMCSGMHVSLGIGRKSSVLCSTQANNLAACRDAWF